jgi:hypothetical protein
VHTDEWTDWIPLTSCLGARVIPAEAGLYRLRARGDNVLAYVGQTGRSLRERLNALRGIYGHEMPYRDPHTVAPALWAWLRAAGVELEASVRSVPGSTPQRKALEAVTIAVHRQEHGVSPRWNFGRMPPGFRMSSANNARLTAAGARYRGGPSEEILASHVPGVSPTGRLDPDVHGAAWGGHRWSPWSALTDAQIARIPPRTGLYRVRGRSTGLLYIGEGRIRDRLRAHSRKVGEQTQQGRVLASKGPLEYSTVMAEWQTHQRLELETDLIAAHTLAFGVPPAAQYIG